MSKFNKLAFLDSKRDAATTSLSIDHDDLFKNYLIAVDRALSKYDKRKGALTSYIRRWFMNAKTNPEFQHEYGKSFDVSAVSRNNIVQGKINVNNLAVSLDHPKVKNLSSDSYGNSEDDIIEYLSQARQLRLISSVRKARFPCLTLGIPYVLSEEERHKLTSTMASIESLTM